MPKYRMRSPYLDENGNVTEAFAVEYHRVMAGNVDRPKDKRADERKPGTIGWLFEQYQRSENFLDSKPSTQRDKRSVLGRYCETVGNLPFQKLRKKDVKASRQKRRETPGAADKLVKYLKSLFEWALTDDDIMRQFPIEENPAKGIPKLNKSDGFHTWTEQELTTFRAMYPLGTTARVAIELMLNVGARRSDVVKLGPRNINGNRIEFTPGKGASLGQSKRISLPITDELQEALASVPSGQETFLQTEYGKPFSSNGFGNKMRQWCDQVGLSECSSHGLRKAAATILAEAGATETQLMAIFGWSDPKMARHYTKAANDKISADEGYSRRKNYLLRKNVPLSPHSNSSGTKRGKNAGKSTPRKWSGGPGGTRTPNQSVMSGRL